MSNPFSLSIRAILKVLPSVENKTEGQDGIIIWARITDDVGIMQQVSGHQGTAIKLALFGHLFKIEICVVMATQKSSKLPSPRM